MKIYTLIIVAILFISCKEKVSFIGISDLTIDNKIENVKIYKYLTKINDTLFKSDKINLNDSIGIIENLEIITDNNIKIKSVRFDCTKFTNISNIYKKVKIGSEEIDMSSRNENSPIKISFFESTNKKVTIISTTVLGDNEDRTSFSYNDNLYETKKKKTKDNIEKIEYSKDVKNK